MAYLRVSVEGDQVDWEAFLLGLDALVFHVEDVVQDDLEVVGLFLGFLVEVEVPAKRVTGGTYTLFKVGL